MSTDKLELLPYDPKATHDENERVRKHNEKVFAQEIIEKNELRRPPNFDTEIQPIIMGDVEKAEAEKAEAEEAEEAEKKNLLKISRRKLLKELMKIKNLMQIKKKQQ